MTFDERYFNIGRLDRLSYGDSFIHRLDPRTKVIATILFLFTVVSFPKYEVVALAPFFLFPILLMTLGGISLRFIALKVLMVSPFAILIGIFNPLFDTQTVTIGFGTSISAGWISFAAILVKFTLTVSTALLLVATTSFPGVCQALRRLGCPAIFVTQLLFLYRYLFVLAEEAMRIVRARDLRCFGRQGRGVKIFARLVGTLLVRSLDRAERIYRAMLSRGFAGDIPRLGGFRLRSADLAFAAAMALFLVTFRFFPLTEEFGRFAQELWR